MQQTCQLRVLSVFVGVALLINARSTCDPGCTHQLSKSKNRSRTDANDVDSARAQKQQQRWDATVGVINGSRPLVIAHRGSPGQLPDHTLEGYRMAIDEGADCVECDVVVTKDLKLICRHEPWLQFSTDADSKFPEYKQTNYIAEGGGNVSGIFSIDLTLEQIKQLRAKQPIPWRDQSHNYKLSVATFEEYVQVVTDASNPRVTCIYPEIKHPTFFNNHPVLREAGTTIDDLLMAELTRLGYNLWAPYGSSEWLERPIFVQSAEQENLRYWKSKTAVPLIQLVDDVPTADTGATPEYLITDSGIAEIAEYAWGYAPWKGLYIVTDGANSITSINPQPIRTALQLGLPVTAWTLRNEAASLASEYLGNAANEFNLLFNLLGATAGFTDHTYSLVPWVQQQYQPAASAAAADEAAAGNSSVYAAAGTPPWAFAPLCLVVPSTHNPVIRDLHGGMWLRERGVPCAYRGPALQTAAAAAAAVEQL